MSIAPSIPVTNMSPADPRIDLNSTSTSPPITPPTRSSGPDAGSVSLGLPSPPPSSSSKRLASSNNQQDFDQGLHRHTKSIDESSNYNNSSNIQRQQQPEPLNSNSSQNNPTKTHSSSSSTSSSASVSASTSGHQLPATNLITNKHIAVAKTKILGHLTRSTSSEVDSEVANALASGRSIVSKTDWKDEDAQYLVQLIETQFPKGNIIWDWVGQQMTSRGFTKSQCRSKWKRIRTKVLHGNDPPNKDRDSKDHNRDHEHDELHEEDDDNMADHRSMTADSRQRHDYDERPSYSDPYRQRQYDSRDYYDQHRPDDHYYGRDRKDGYRSQYSPALHPPSHSHRTSVSHRSNRYEEDNWSDDDRTGRYNNDLAAKRYSQDYYNHPSSPRSQQYHNRRQSNPFPPRDDVQDENNVRSIAAINSTPTSFGKIEWKPEDSDYLVHLIESKFASRKVDWAWVSKQMEGRGYDRTQCKSRWWRVQHRQNQNNNNNNNNNNQHNSTSQNSNASQSISRGTKPDQTPDQTPTDADTNSRNDKDNNSDEEMTHQHSPKQSLTADQESPSAQSGAQPMQIDEIESNNQLNSDTQGDDESRNDNRGSSNKAQEHQKHIEWKDEDSQYMYHLIEKEFPVGNVIWSVIGEKMQSRGYSQTQCMSKWRRHLKNSKAPNDSSKSGISMDLDTDMDPISRRRGVDDRHAYSDSFSDNTKRFRRDGTDLARYDRNGEYRVVDPMDARLVEMEYDRYYDAGGKRKRISDAGLESSSSLRNRSHSPPRDNYYSYEKDIARTHYVENTDSQNIERDGYGSGRNFTESSRGDRRTSASLYAQERGRSNSRNGDIHPPTTSAVDSQPWHDDRRDDYGSKYASYKAHRRNRSPSVSLAPREYYESGNYSRVDSDSSRPRNPDYGGPSSRQSPDYDSPRGIREDYAGGMDRQSRSMYDHDEYDRRKGRYPQRTRYDDRDETDFIDYALEDEMDWAAGRWESRDMARLAAAVAKQGRRWDAIRAQIKIPVLVSQHDEINNDAYDGLQYDGYPSTSTSKSTSTYPHYQKETRKSQSSQHHQQRLSRDLREVRQQQHNSSGNRYESHREPRQIVRQDYPEKIGRGVKPVGLQPSLIAVDSLEVNNNNSNQSENIIEDDKPMENSNHRRLAEETEDIAAGSASVKDDNTKVTESIVQSESESEVGIENSKDQRGDDDGKAESYEEQSNETMEDVTIEVNASDK